jgi:hypothetical protein
VIYSPQDLRGPIFVVVEDDATRHFVALLMNDWRFQLCKCRYSACRKYFLNKNKTQRRWKHGTFCCREHRNRASAATLTETRRKKEKASLISIAAKYLSERTDDSSWFDKPLVKRKVAEVVSERMKKDDHVSCARLSIRRNWVTRHSVDIEEKRLELIEHKRLQRNTIQ